MSGADGVCARTAVVVLNHDGCAHLDACLRAALALDGLAGPSAVVVVDNGSTDGSVDHVRAAHPGVTIIPLPANTGFAAGNNAAAHAIDAEWLFLLNNDTAAGPDALRRLAAQVGRDVRCAGARLVDWDGARLDFDGGGAAFTGHGHPLGHGRPVPRRQEASRPTLFASGAAMLVHRETFLAVGGFDPAYFAYYEDVDLGWRLWLAGREVRHVPAATVRHRGGGTAARLPASRRRCLHERNALATVVKCYDDANLRRVLPAAVALAAVRAGARPEVIETAAPAGRDGLPVPGAAWPGWAALEPLELDLPALARARRTVQAARCRPDPAVLPLLVDPLAPVPPTPAMRAATDRAVERFELASTFGRRAGASAVRAGARRRADAMRDRIPLAGRLLDRATRRREGIR